jgi:hypothetical protein
MTRAILTSCLVALGQIEESALTLVTFTTLYVAFAIADAIRVTTNTRTSRHTTVAFHFTASSSKFYSTLADISIDIIFASSIVLAGRAITLVDVTFTDVSCESLNAVTTIAILKVLALSSVLTWKRSANVDIFITQRPCIVRRTHTGEHGHTIHTCSTIQARVGCTVIYHLFTKFPFIISDTLTIKIVYPILASPVILTRT